MHTLHTYTLRKCGMKWHHMVETSRSGNETSRSGNETSQSGNETSWSGNETLQHGKHYSLGNIAVWDLMVRLDMYLSSIASLQYCLPPSNLWSGNTESKVDC